ncbi:MAG TPA: Tol-Pal system beta propeller repeat protein TolB [Steroidobacteraceae bacterium]|nr:Tol-Pal system beta propeller repeat protein TolB [Steroidobacteraceae bacterium]
MSDTTTNPSSIEPTPARRPRRYLAAALMAACVLSLAALALAVSPAHADLQVLITKGVTDPIPIAVVPFAHVPADGGFDVAGVVQQDLTSSGRFRPMARESMRVLPTSTGQVQAADWKAEGEDYVLVGRVSSPSPGVLDLDCDLINTATGQPVGSQRFIADSASLRNAAHQVSDFVYQKILGVRGAFATRIAYVTVQGEAPQRRFRLVIADADGENPRVILESGQPIMSPAWSADGQWIAYVSFENRLSAVYVQRVSTGERRLVSARAGVNDAPAFSPDGKQLALTLSGSGGNLDIWLLNLGTQQRTRLTDDPAIDTEPAWSPDGASIYFTSDRAGGPQIYRLGVANPSRVQRITFGSSYDARPAVSPDGKRLAFITLDGGNYRIAVQDLASGTVTILSHGHLDQSPSFAPNGATIIYAGRDADVDTLQTVSVDGLVMQRLKSSDQGQVREPVWGPFAR